MNRLRLVVERQALPESPAEVLEIYVDDLRLASLAGVVELPFAEAEGHPDLAGSYVGLPRWEALDRHHFLGEPALSWFGDGDTVLLGCGCGEWGCWPLTATVTVDSDTVRWSHFRTGHRDWDLSRMGPFAFNRVEYEAVLDATLVANR